MPQGWERASRSEESGVPGGRREAWYSRPPPPAVGAQEGGTETWLREDLSPLLLAASLQPAPPLFSFFSASSLLPWVRVQPHKAQRFHEVETGERMGPGTWKFPFFINLLFRNWERERELILWLTPQMPPTGLEPSHSPYNYLILFCQTLKMFY